MELFRSKLITYYFMKNNWKFCVRLQMQQKEEKSLIIRQSNKTVEANQSPLLLLFDKMSAQDFVLIPEENYAERQAKVLEVMDDPTSHEKGKLLTILPRHWLKKEKEEKSEKKSGEHQNMEKLHKRVLNSFSMLSSAQKEKTRPILEKIEEKWSYSHQQWRSNQSRHSNHISWCNNLSGQHSAKQRTNIGSWLFVQSQRSWKFYAFSSKLGRKTDWAINE